jgi:transposase
MRSVLNRKKWALPSVCTTQQDLFDHNVIEHDVTAIRLCTRRAPKARCILETRQLKGLHIAAESRIEQQGDTWLVPSEHSNKRYTVRLGPHPSCTCLDFEARQQACKHIFAVDGILHQQPIAEIPEPVKRLTYKQEWPAYNQAQVSEKRRFQTLLYELCKGIEEPSQQHMGRPRLPIADVIFALCYKVYSTFSTRRFSTDLMEAHLKGYLSRKPSYNSICDYFMMESLTPYLKQLIVESSLPLKAVETDFAVDSSGFSTGVYQKWVHAKYGAGQTIKKEDWLKVHLMCGVKTNIVTSVEITGAHAGDSPQFKPLVKQTAKNFVMQEVSADKAYLSSGNLRLVVDNHAMPYIPFKSNSTTGDKRQSKLWKEMFHYYSYNQESFMQSYHKRSNVETTFSMIKAKFGERLRSKTVIAQTNEVLCKVLCHNLCCVIQSIYELGIEPTFWID